MKTKDDVTTALDKIADELEADEIERRLQKTLGYDGFRPARPLADVGKQVAEFVAALQAKYLPEEVEKHRKDAETAVASIKDAARRREFYDGKKILEVFHQSYIAKTNLKRTHFLFLVAKEARDRKSVKKFFTGMFDVFLEQKNT